MAKFRSFAKTLPYQFSYDLFSFRSKKIQIAKCCLFPDFFLYKVHFFYKQKIQERVSAEVSQYSVSFSSKVNQYEYIDVQHLFKPVIFFIQFNGPNQNKGALDFISVRVLSELSS